MTLSSKPQVVIAGGSGFLGSGLKRFLHEHGSDVRRWGSTAA